MSGNSNRRNATNAMCIDLRFHTIPRIESNSRGDTMRNSPILPKTNKSRSPEIRYSHPANAASARMRSSSGSRHSGGGCAESMIPVVRLSTNIAIRWARGAGYRNFFTSFSSTSRTMGRPEKTSHRLTIRLQSCRQNPRRAVRTDNQTLLSSRTRIRRDHARKRQNLFLSHFHFGWHTIRPCEEGVIILLHKPTEHLRTIICGQLLQFFDHLGGGHVCRLVGVPGFSSLRIA